MKKRKQMPQTREIVFLPALAPLEASVIPAAEKRRYGALRHAREAFRLDGQTQASDARQRAKIWVR